MIMKTVRVISAGWSSSGLSMGTLVDEGILTKKCVADRRGSYDIIWTNVSKDVIVENTYETILPGESVIWEK